MMDGLNQLILMKITSSSSVFLFDNTKKIKERSIDRNSKHCSPKP